MRRRVLIVDDNQALAEDLGEILESEGFTARVYFDPLRVRAEAHTLDFDVALLDVRMPGMDGVQLFRELAGSHPNAAFILMSAYADERLIQEALTEGVRLVLPKPLSLPTLLEAVSVPLVHPVSS